jgi:hypothetical protein
MCAFSIVHPVTRKINIWQNDFKKIMTGRGDFGMEWADPHPIALPNLSEVLRE